jgi:hypothetical protein
MLGLVGMQVCLCEGRLGSVCCNVCSTCHAPLLRLECPLTLLLVLLHLTHVVGPAGRERKHHTLTSAEQFWNAKELKPSQAAISVPQNARLGLSAV